MDMIHKGTLDTILMKSFDRLSYSGSFMNTLVEKVNRHSALAQDPLNSLALRSKVR